MKKNYYYVIVLSEGKAKFVTKINNATRFATWNENEKPKEFAKRYAEDLVFCLNFNGYPAFILTSCYEIDNQIFIKKKD